MATVGGGSTSSSPPPPAQRSFALVTGTCSKALSSALFSFPSGSSAEVVLTRLPTSAQPDLAFAGLNSITGPLLPAAAVTDATAPYLPGARQATVRAAETTFRHEVQCVHGAQRDFEAERLVWRYLSLVCPPEPLRIDVVLYTAGLGAVAAALNALGTALTDADQPVACLPMAVAVRVAAGPGGLHEESSAAGALTVDPRASATSEGEALLACRADGVIVLQSGFCPAGGPLDAASAACVAVSAAVGRQLQHNRQAICSSWSAPQA